MNGWIISRGFLPAEDPLRAFPLGSELSVLDEIGRDLPSLLEDNSFRSLAREWKLPLWNAAATQPDQFPALRLYYLRLAFFSSAYINQQSQPRATVLPKSLAVPLCEACRILGRPAVLGYDGYVLYNWKRLNPNGPLELGNIDSLQNFVHRYEEHWLIAVHVVIESLAGKILEAIDEIIRAMGSSPASSGAGVRQEAVNSGLWKIGETLHMQLSVLRRLPDKMDAVTYQKYFRPYTRQFENVMYEGMDERPMNYRAEITAQSAILPALSDFLKIPHEETSLTQHWTELRRYMPAEHRAVLEEIQRLPSVREFADKRAFNSVLESIVHVREFHHRWSSELMDRRERDPRGAGYLQGLAQLIRETKSFMIP